MCRWFESNRGSQEELSFSVPLFSWLEKTAKSQQLLLLDPKGGSWQQSGGLLQPPWLCRSKASPTGGAKRELGLPGSFFFGQAPYWLPDLRADEGSQPLHAGRDFSFFLAIQRIHIFCPAQMRKKTESPKII